MQAPPLPTLKKSLEVNFTIYLGEVLSKKTDRNANPYVSEEPEQAK